jgi:hypothetical protein
MEDFSTLIYIVIAIVALFISARNNANKAQNKAKQPIVSSNNSALENILNNQIPPEWKVQPKKQKTVDMLGVSVEEEGSVTNKELEPILEYKKPKKKVEDSKKDMLADEKFDAKKAIIYSTIINKKYF